MVCKSLYSTISPIDQGNVIPQHKVLCLSVVATRILAQIIEDSCCYQNDQGIFCTVVPATTPSMTFGNAQLVIPKTGKVIYMIFNNISYYIYMIFNPR